MLPNEILLCGECLSWANGKCLKTGTIGVEPEAIEFGSSACEDFEEGQ